MEISNTVLIAVEGGNLSLSCNASGKPAPVITWIQVGDSEVLAQGSSISVVNITRPGTPDSMIQYQCTASNGVESPVKAVANVTVHCKYQADWNFPCILFKHWSLVVTINVAKPQTQTLPNLINMRMCNILKIYLICFCQLCIRSCRINMNLLDGYAHNRAFSPDYHEKHLTSSSLKFKYCMTCNVWYQMRSLFFWVKLPYLWMQPRGILFWGK